MAEIRIYPDPVLRRESMPLNVIDSETKEMLDDMKKTMYACKGIGLAAPQIGVPFRIIIVHSEHGLIQLINPEILESEGEEKGDEGCLSLPDISVNVVRDARILIKGVDANEREVEYEASGLLARIFQHEIDHLRGKLIIDRLSKPKRDLFKSTLKKRKK